MQTERIARLLLVGQRSSCYLGVVRLDGWVAKYPPPTPASAGEEQGEEREGFSAGAGTIRL